MVMYIVLEIVIQTVYKKMKRGIASYVNLELTKLLKVYVKATEKHDSIRLVKSQRVVNIRVKEERIKEIVVSLQVVIIQVIVKRTEEKEEVNINDRVVRVLKVQSLSKYVIEKKIEYNLF